MKISSIVNFTLILFVSAALSGSTGCSDIFNGKTREGVIEFDVTYPGMTTNTMGLPDKATYKFKKESSITEFSGMMGLIRIAYLADGVKKNAMQTLNLVDKKYVSDLTLTQINEINKEFVISAKPVDGKKEIAGYKCKKAEITLSNGTFIEAWYTTELGTETINWCNPYNQLKGVMMEFEMQKYNITMKLTAKSVTKDPVSDNDWKVDDDYKKIPIKEQNKILEDLNPNPVK